MGNSKSLPSSYQLNEIVRNKIQEIKGNIQPDQKYLILDLIGNECLKMSPRAKAILLERACEELKDTPVPYLLTVKDNFERYIDEIDHSHCACNCGYLLGHKCCHRYRYRIFLTFIDPSSLQEEYLKTVNEELSKFPIIQPREYIFKKFHGETALSQGEQTKHNLDLVLTPLHYTTRTTYHHHTYTIYFSHTPEQTNT